MARNVPTRAVMEVKPSSIEEWFCDNVATKGADAVEDFSLWLGKKVRKFI